MEETGLVVPYSKYCGTLVETLPADYNWISFIYLAETELIPPPFCNESTSEWIGFDEALNIPTPASDCFIYKYLLEENLFAFNAVYDSQMQLLYMQDDLTGEIVYGKLPEY